RALAPVEPAAWQRGLGRQLISRLERRGLRIAAARLLQIDRNLAAQHYAEHTEKPFYETLVSFITACPVVAAVLEGPNAVEIVRSTMGATDPRKAAPGTIRGDLGLNITQNLIHGSDSLKSAGRELGLFFVDGAFHSYQHDIERWLCATHY